MLGVCLATQTEVRDHFRVPFGRIDLEIVQQLAALVHHLEEATAGRMVTLVGIEVCAETVDPLREKRDLNLRRPSIICAAGELRDDTGFRGVIKWHVKGTS